MGERTDNAIDSLVNGLVQYVDNKIQNIPYVKTDIGKVKSVTLTNNKYLHTVTVRGYDYTNIKSIGNNEFTADSVVYILVPNGQYSNMFILGHLDDTNANIKGGTINIGDGNFVVDENGSVTIKYGNIDIDTLDLSGYYDKTEVDDLLDDKADTSSLANVAFSGSYTDLINKPTIPTKTSDLQNDSGFITNTVNNLTNYYLKTETYNKTEVDNLISQIATLQIEVVQTLPTHDISTNTIYLVPKQTAGTQDIYDEYIYVNNAWEHIGDTEVDLSNYYTKTETESKIDEKINLLDVTGDSNIGANKTIKTWSETDGKVNITTQDISITKSQISDFSHSHGNITNGGALQTNDITIANGDKLVVTDASNSNKIARTSVAFDGSTTSTALTPKGTFEAFVQDANYVHTDNNYTTTEKNKLSGIESGAEVNVQADWNQTTTTADDYIKNKPTIPTVNNATLTVTQNGTSAGTFTANANSDVTIPLTDANVTQTVSTTDAEYRVLFSNSANNTTETAGVKKNSGITYNPSTNIFTVSKIVASATTDASGTADNQPALRIGNISGQHLELDPNEIMAKASATTTNSLFINTDGGNVQISKSGVTMKPYRVCNFLTLTGSGTAGSTSSDTTPIYTPAKWTFNTTNTVENGDVIFIKIPVAGHANGVYLSIDNGTTYQPISINSKTRLQTQYENGQYLMLMYESSGKCTTYPLNGGTTTSDVTGIWRVVNYRDTNTTYSSMTSTELTTGTETAQRVVRADYLKSGINSLIDTKINELDGGTIGTGATNKTITSLSQTNGNVSATFSNIALGNITSAGALQSTGIAIANGDALVVTDSSDSNKVAKTTLTFDGSTTNKCLTQKGTWESFTNTSGTVTSVKVGNTTYNPTDGVVSLPAYPTVNNATLTVTQNGTSVGTFTANASSAVTIPLTDTVTRVKGSEQTSYSTGDVSLSANNVGAIPKIQNTADNIASCSGGGTYSYFKIASLVVSGTNSNKGAVVFEISQRRYPLSRLQLSFVVSSGNYSVQYFTTDYDNHYWINQVDNTHWDIYGQYNEKWGFAYLHRITGAQVNRDVAITVVMDNVADIDTSTMTQVVYGGNAGYATSAGSATSATTATKLGSSNVGTATKPIYLASGTATACTYELNKTVPANAVFTDENVSQTNLSATNTSYYRLLLSGTNNDTTETKGSYKSTNLRFRSSTASLYILNSGATTDNKYSELQLAVKDTTTSQTTESHIRAYSDHRTSSGYGNNLVINSGTALILGSGEAGDNHYTALGANYQSENLFVTSDSSLHLQSNAQTIADRKGFLITTGHELVPEVADVATNNTGSIGTSTYKLANGYFTNINGVAVGTPEFSDTKNTAGSTNTSSKIYLVGATSQGANPQTYSDDEVYTTSGTLTSKKTDTKAIIARTGTGTAGSTSSDNPPVQKPTKWTFNADITVANGEVYFIKIPEAGGTYGVWASLNNGTNYYPVAVSNGKSRFTTHYAKNTVIAVTYESAGKCTCYPLAGGTATEDVTGIFRVLNDYDANTNTYVTQTATTTNANYEVLFSSTADNTTRTEGARKNSNLKFNPSTGNLQATQLNGVAIGSSPKFTDEKVKQTLISSGNTSYPVLFSQTANTSTTTDIYGSVYRDNGVTINPSTGTLTAIRFKCSSVGSIAGAGLVLVEGTIKADVSGQNEYTFIDARSVQGLLISASDEADYKLFLGVDQPGTSSAMWGLAPNTFGKLNCGTAGRKWDTVYARTGTINTSDIKEKKDIVDLDNNAKDLIMSLKPVSYKFIDGTSGRTHYGMIAQDVEEELEDLGMTAMDFAGFCKDQKAESYEEDGKTKYRDIEGEYTYGLRYEEFIAPLIKTVQIQQTEIDTLKQEVELLKQEIDLLKNK